MIRKNKNLVLFISLFLLISSILVVFLQKFTPLVSHVSYYCQSILENPTIPIPYYLSIIPFIILFVILVLSMIKFFALYIEVRFYRKKLKSSLVIKPYMQVLLKQLQLGKKVIVIQSEKHLAFCLGIRKPKIYISTGLLSVLTEKETEVVLRHEQYHLESYDTFTMIVATVCRSMFPFFPLVGDLIQKYRVEREIQADKFAVSKVGNADILVSTLRKLLISPSNESSTLAAIANQDTLEPRIYSLLEKPYNLPRINIQHTLITLFSFFMFGVLIVSPVQAKEFHHDHYDVVLLTTEKTPINTCITKGNK